MVLNLLRLCLSRAVKWLFQMYYQQYTSRNEHFKYGYVHSDALSNEPVHEISNNGMCDQQSLRSACAYAQTDQSLCKSLEYSMIVKLLTENHLEYPSLKGGCRGSSESYCHIVGNLMHWLKCGCVYSPQLPGAYNHLPAYEKQQTTMMLNL